jgi:hypothetical protein
MKKKLFNLILVFVISTSFTSCYTYSMTIGKGAQTGIEYRKMNHYLIYGLAPISTANVKEMAGGAIDYEIIIKHTFVDGLLNALTCGIYTPTTTIVRK